MAKPTTSGFTISGLLDRSASIRNDYPVERIPIEEIADHPANAAYSMDDVNSALAAPKMAVPAGGSADAMSDRDAGGSERRLRSRRRSALYHAAFFRYAEQFDDLAGRFSARFYCIDAHGQGSGVSCRTQLCRSGGRYLCD